MTPTKKRQEPLAGTKRKRTKEEEREPPQRSEGTTTDQTVANSRSEPEKKRPRVVASSEAKEPATEDKENVMEALESEDYFEVLGLARDCSDADVRRAYRKLAVQWHPDKNRSHPRAEEFFKKIGEAYAVLGDPESRARYETFGRAGMEPNGGAEEGWDAADAFHDPFVRAGFSARHARDIFDAFFRGSDPFAELFGGFGGQPRRPRQSRTGMDDVMGFGPMMGMGMGFGGSGGGLASMMSSFFGDSMSSMSSFGGGGFGGGASFSSSVSSSSFTDPQGHVVTRKTTTTVDASGRAETVTEEFRNGSLVSSSSSVGTSRLAGAGRMQLGGAAVASTGSLGGEAQPSRRRSSRPRY